MNASRYAFPISAPHSSRLLSLPRNITNLRFLSETTPEYIYFQWAQELGGHQPPI